MLDARIQVQYASGWNGVVMRRLADQDVLALIKVFRKAHLACFEEEE
jgi:hypothetical protein